MSSVPVFLLKKLYVKGSLKNTATGFELTIQNTLAPGTILGLAPLKVDGAECPLAQTTVLLSDGTRLSMSDVSAKSPLRFNVGDKVTIQVLGQPLPAGPHKITVSPKTKEAGVLPIPADDTIT
jgi:protein involved in polysaccharide export with SLBB domain